MSFSHTDDAGPPGLRPGGPSAAGRAALWLIGAALAPQWAWGCACGCGIFNLGIPELPNSFYPSEVSLQYNYMNQDQTQHGDHPVPGDLNADKRIETSFFDLYAQHQINRDWGIMSMVPVWSRGFVTDTTGIVGSTDAAQGVSPQLETSHATVLSDIRILGMYTGFSDDMSTGIEFGLKLPTGPTSAGDRFQGAPLMDRDTQPGTGTTDLLLGGFRMGNWTHAGWFLQGLWRHAFDTYQGYRPGDSLNMAAGVHYDGWVATARIMPLLQLSYQWRAHDQGGGDAQYGNANSGYSNLYLNPGLQLNLSRRWLANASIYLPVYRHVNGYQQVAPSLINLGVSLLF